MNGTLLSERITQAARGAVTELAPGKAARRLVGRTDAARVRETLRALRDEAGCQHLSAISAVDDGKATIEVVYHLSAPEGFVVSLKATIARDAPSIESVTSVMPAATLYEREMHDLFGIAFPGHPNLARLILSDTWPPGEHPLRKDWKGKDAEGAS